MWRPTGKSTRSVRAFPPRNVCVSLCAQPPSSPENPSVGICGIEENVEEVYSLLVQHHLVPDDGVESLSTPHFSAQDSSACWQQDSPVAYYASSGKLSPSCYYYSRPEAVYSTYKNSPYPPFQPAPYPSQMRMGVVPGDYGTILSNSPLDNFPFVSASQNAARSHDALPYADSYQLKMDDRHANPFWFDNEKFFPKSSTNEMDDFFPLAAPARSAFDDTATLSAVMNPVRKSEGGFEPARKGFAFSASNFNEFIPAGAKKEAETENRPRRGSASAGIRLSTGSMDSMASKGSTGSKGVMDPNAQSGPSNGLNGVNNGLNGPNSASMGPNGLNGPSNGLNGPNSGSTSGPILSNGPTGPTGPTGPNGPSLFSTPMVSTGSAGRSSVDKTRESTGSTRSRRMSEGSRGASIGGCDRRARVSSRDAAFGANRSTADAFGQAGLPLNESMRPRRHDDNFEMFLNPGRYLDYFEYRRR